MDGAQVDPRSRAISMAGMGLGLYISRQIVELHGDRIEADFPTSGEAQMAITLPRQPAG